MTSDGVAEVVIYLRQVARFARKGFASKLKDTRYSCDTRAEFGAVLTRFEAERQDLEQLTKAGGHLRAADADLQTLQEK
jgi:hypothetical protein